MALLGFPLGGLPAAAGAVNVPLARPLASAGIIQGVTAERIEVAGYGERGASGSPVVDATGSVVGLLRGAVIRDEGQVDTAHVGDANRRGCREHRNQRQLGHLYVGPQSTVA